MRHMHSSEYCHYVALKKSIEPDYKTSVSVKMFHLVQSEFQKDNILL